MSGDKPDEAQNYDIIKEFQNLFLFYDENGEPSKDKSLVTEYTIKTLQRQAWLGKLNSPPLRGLYWRIFLGFLDANFVQSWANTLKLQVEDYECLKKKILPGVSKVNVDPLSSFASSKHGQQSEEWRKFDQQVELANFITIDVDRLYMAGVDDEYFQRPRVKEKIHSVLFVWSLKNDRVSYRQGMHEIVGSIYHVLEEEFSAWSKFQTSDPQIISHPLSNSFSEENVEAYLYYLFERIMIDMVALYDPMPMLSNNSDSVPPIVDYCSRIQEHFLRQIDPELSDQLEANYIQAQIYGLRWARLLLGREFPLTNSQSLRLWDYMFAYCMEEASSVIDDEVLEELTSAHASVSSATRALRARYGIYSPLMGVLGDFILSMLLHIRQALMEGDSNDILSLLMKYPKMDDITPIMDLADMLRRGVLSLHAHINLSQVQSQHRHVHGTNLPPGASQSRHLLANPLVYNPYAPSSALDAGESPGGVSTPSWLMSHPLLPAFNTAATNMSKRVSDQFRSVVQRAGDQINQIRLSNDGHLIVGSGDIEASDGNDETSHRSTSKFTLADMLFNTQNSNASESINSNGAIRASSVNKSSLLLANTRDSLTGAFVLGDDSNNFGLAPSSSGIDKFSLLLEKDPLSSVPSLPIAGESGAIGVIAPMDSSSRQIKRPIVKAKQPLPSKVDIESPLHLPSPHSVQISSPISLSVTPSASNTIAASIDQLKGVRVDESSASAAASQGQLATESKAGTVAAAVKGALGGSSDGDMYDAISERLLEIADSLLASSDAPLAISDAFSVTGPPSELNVRTKAARKLCTLADVLAGNVSLGAYDRQHGYRSSSSSTSSKSI